MTGNETTPIHHRTAPAELREATLQLHHAVQLLAAAGQSFAVPRDDDSHRALVWSDEARGFVGAPFARGYPLRTALRVGDMTLALLERSGNTFAELALPGRTLEDAYRWVAQGLGSLFSARVEIARPEYEIPAHPVGDGAPFSDQLGPALTAFEALYGGAAGTLAELASRERAASPVRCWPHHFDLATLLTVRPQSGDQPAQTVGVGLAPMGGGYDTWYWYVSPWPVPQVDSLVELEGPGRWHTRGWVGAVLTGEEIVREAHEDDGRALVREFLDRSVPAAKALLVDPTG